MREVAVIGGGAAGMMVSVLLAGKGYVPVIYEKNNKLGRKLFITGKGRCNLTNNCDTEDLLGNVVSNSKFMYSSFYGFDSADTIKFFTELGLPLKTERGGRVFPVSDHSSDVIGVLKSTLGDCGAVIKTDSEVVDILYDGDGMYDEKKSGPKGHITGIAVRENGSIKKYSYSQVIVATGGLSYPQTGSTGDGIRWAEKLGLGVKDPSPALVPINVREKLCGELMGLTLKNVGISFEASVNGKNKVIYSDMGELLFTHFGISGPIVLSGSSFLGKYADGGYKIYIDLKPALSYEQLDLRIQRDFKDNLNRQFRNSLNRLLPRRLIPYVIDASGIDMYKRVNEISREERKRLADKIKRFELTPIKTRGFDEAIITQGGVKTCELNPSTMESKKIKGLYFIGEVIDVDALTGGYNLQIAWSTAYACAESFLEG